MAEGTGEGQATIAKTGAPDVFVSYASPDTAVANAIVEILEGNGLRCWIAPRDVVPGSHYADGIMSAISGAKALVLVLSGSALVSKHVGKEVERASSKGRPIIAIHTDTAPLTSSFEYFLSESQWIELGVGGLAAVAAKLFEAVRLHLETTVANEPRPALAPPVTVRAAPLPRWRWVIAGGAILSLALAYFIIDKLWLSKRVAAENLIAVGAAASNPALPVIQEKSVAVLPFVDMSEKKDQEYFGDGMTEELIDLLVKVPGLYVPARTSTFYFKGKQTTISDIAKALGVAHVLEGSVRRAGKTLRITAQLVRVDNGYHLWSKTYDRQLDDVFQIQDEIANAVVEQLKITLLGAAPMAKAADPKAHDLFLQGRQLSRQKTPEGFTHAIALYEQALTIDPRYAAAWSGLGEIYISQASEGLRSVDEGYRLSREAATKALALDSDLASAHAQFGWIAINYDRDLVKAAEHIGRALKLAPDDTYVLHNAVILAWSLGRFDTAIAISEAEVARDPANGLAHDSLGDAYCFASRWDACLSSYRTALALNPGYIGGHASASFTLLAKGELDAALSEALQEKSERSRLSCLSIVYDALGRKAEADAAYAEMIKKYERQWPYGVAMMVHSRGETDKVFDYLDKAAASREPLLFQILGTFGDLRGDPRWLPLLRKIGRAPEQLAAVKFDVNLPK